MASHDPVRYLLLCRHARHDDGRLVPVRGDDDWWRFPTASVARALAEELVIGSDRLRLAKVVYAPTPEASRTAGLLVQRLRGEAAVAESQPQRQPDPARNGTYSTVAQPEWLPESDGPDAHGYRVEHEEWEELLPSRLQCTKVGAYNKIQRTLDELRNGSNALLIVGHQPQLGWLSSYLSAGRGLRRAGHAIPLAASEVACLRLRKGKGGRWRGWLIWTIVPDDKAALEAVTDKVKSKMESAKLLSAVITLALTASLGVLLDATRWNGLTQARASLGGLSYSGQTAVQVAFVLLLAALALYLLTMYAYDSLLMPTRFWAESPGRDQDTESSSRSARRRLVPSRAGSWLPRRPPSSAAWIMLRNMQRVWFWLFTPANIFVALALTVLAAALLRMHDWIFVPFGLLGLLVAVWAWWFRPVLGSED